MVQRRCRLRQTVLVLIVVVFATAVCAGLWAQGDDEGNGKGKVAGARVQGEGKKKDDGGAWAVFVLALVWPAGQLLQLLAVGACPRFSRRCANAADRHWCLTPIVGFFGLLAVFIIGALVGQVGGTAAAVPLVITWILVMIGAAGVSRLAGRWAMDRIGSVTEAHPAVEVVFGSTAICWGTILIPCVGQMLWLYVIFASFGAFIMAVIRGKHLDEVRRRPAATPEPTPVAPPTLEPPAPSQPQQTTQHEPPPADDDYSGQVF